MHLHSQHKYKQQCSYIDKYRLQLSLAREPSTKYGVTKVNSADVPVGKPEVIGLLSSMCEDAAHDLAIKCVEFQAFGSRSVYPRCTACSLCARRGCPGTWTSSTPPGNQEDIAIDATTPSAGHRVQDSHRKWITAAVFSSHCRQHLHETCHQGIWCCFRSLFWAVPPIIVMWTNSKQIREKEKVHKRKTNKKKWVIKEVNQEWIKINN